MVLDGNITWGIISLMVSVQIHAPGHYANLVLIRRPEVTIEAGGLFTKLHSLPLLLLFLSLLDLTEHHLLNYFIN